MDQLRFREYNILFSGSDEGPHDTLGLTVLDEPCAKQSDPSVLDLQLRAVTKHSAGTSARSKKVTGGEEATRDIEKWIKDISDLHRSKPPPSVNYRHPMPDIDKLMQVITLKLQCP